MKYFVYAVIFIVFAAIIAGFFVAGSPKEERLRRFDDRRVSDLRFLQSQIIYYWQSKSHLPAGLADLNDATRGAQVPADPETNAPYGYGINESLKFSLCATFDLPSVDQQIAPKAAPYPAAPYYTGGNDSWAHASGLVCFLRTIDPDFYKPIKSAQ